jgi:hypothetical protein
LSLVPGRLHRIARRFLNQSPATYLTCRESARVFEGIGLWNDTSVSVTGVAEPERVEALLVTDGTFDVAWDSAIQPRLRPYQW